MKTQLVIFRLLPFCALGLVSYSSYAESTAAILTAAVAFMRAPLVVTVLTGVISVVLLRMVLT